jgi:hypothetical protein
MRIHFKSIRSNFSSWKTMFQEADEVASRLPPERLININATSEPGGGGLVTVWYWASDEEYEALKSKSGDE